MLAQYWGKHLLAVPPKLHAGFLSHVSLSPITRHSVSLTLPSTLAPPLPCSGFFSYSLAGGFRWVLPAEAHSRWRPLPSGCFPATRPGQRADAKLWRALYSEMRVMASSKIQSCGKEPMDQSIQTIPATKDHWEDIREFFERIPCLCQYWRMTSSEYGRARKQTTKQWLGERQAALRKQVAAPNPPAVLAYKDGLLVGWCGFGPRSQMGRLSRSRTIPSVDDLPIWSIVCFLVRPGYRRQGVANALLAGAIEIARAHGAPALEAYPVDPGSERISSPFAYVGLASMFKRAGFKKVMETSAHSSGLPRLLMRLFLTR
jgi:GNAT superfamily N-acetyltransferase